MHFPFGALDQSSLLVYYLSTWREIQDHLCSLLRGLPLACVCCGTHTSRSRTPHNRTRRHVHNALMDALPLPHSLTRATERGAELSNSA